MLVKSIHLGSVPTLKILDKAIYVIAGILVVSIYLLQNNVTAAIYPAACI